MYTHSKCWSVILESCLSRIATSHNIFHSLNKAASHCQECLSFFSILDNLQRSFHSTVPLILLTLQPKKACRQSSEPLTFLYLDFPDSIALDNEPMSLRKLIFSQFHGQPRHRLSLPPVSWRICLSLPCLWLLVGTIQLHTESPG